MYIQNFFFFNAESPEHEPEWSGSGQSLKRLLEPDISTEDNPKIKQRLKENAITMNKMAELRTQMENLSMLKKSQRKVIKKRPKSGRRSNGPSRQSRISSSWSASTNSSSVIYKKNKKKQGSSMPLPPISTAFDIDELDMLNDDDEDFCTIHPLSETTANCRAALPSLNKKLY